MNEQDQWSRTTLFSALRPDEALEVFRLEREGQIGGYGFSYGLQKENEDDFLSREELLSKLDDFGWRGSRADQHQNASWANPYHLIHSGSGKYRRHVADGISVRRDDYTQQLGKTRRAAKPKRSNQSKAAKKSHALLPCRRRKHAHPGR